MERSGSRWLWPAMVVVAALVLMQGPVVSGRRVDIQREIRQLVRHHNGERRSENIRAPYMMQMSWDGRLAAEAQRWADKCEYRRPSPAEGRVGSNLFYTLNHAEDRHAIHKMISTALRMWTRGKNDYQDELDGSCKRSCDYSQMVYYKSDQIGCAVNTCNSIKVGSRREDYSTLLVCFYSPGVDSRNTRPYRGLPSCSNCPRSTSCKHGLCARPDSEPVPLYVPLPAPTAAPKELADELSPSEQQYVLGAHNRIRGNQNRDPLSWDSYLTRWAKWVVSCDADYPGPRHTYTNFARVNQGEPLYQQVYRWSGEGESTVNVYEHGCRTPGDREPCNHYINLMRPELTSMACAAKACGGSTRQMVCIYDNRVDRSYRRTAESASYTRRNDPVRRRNQPAIRRRNQPIRRREPTRRREFYRRQ